MISAYTNDTICAIATATGRSAQAVIKVSGTNAISITNVIFKRNNDAKLTDLLPYQASYGWIIDPDTQEKIDDAVALVFKAPHSYTGEDVVEITVHGSRFILQTTLELLLNAGARLATGGEFTRRAFLNGKLDLSQAEAVTDLIASENRATLRMALTQVRGGFKDFIHTLREQLISFAAHLELELDFSEEEVEFVSRKDMLDACDDIKRKIDDLLSSYQQGKVIKEGIPVTLFGSTNAGKSTLLNALLQDERAIVSDIPGTTRDTIEDTLYIHDLQLRIIDTAGIRNSNDEIEQIGIRRSIKALKKASLIIWVIDPTQERGENIYRIYEALKKDKTTDAKVLPLVNKSDLTTASDTLLDTIQRLTQENPLCISAHNTTDLDSLKERIYASFDHLEVAPNQLILSNIRHANALSEATQYLTNTIESITSNSTPDIIAQELRAVISSLNSVTGEITSDSILHNIFSRFCIGK